MAALVGAIASGGGLISIPGLIFLGASPVTAIATSRLNLLSGGISAIYRFRKDGAVIWNYIPKLLVLAIIAGVTGPKLLLGIKEQTVQYLVGGLLLVMIPILWIKPNAGTMRVSRSRKRTLAGYPIMGIILFYLSMFGGGAGIFMIYTFVYFFGLTITEANATSLAIAQVTTLISVVTYLTGGAIDFGMGLPLMAGGLIGGYMGAHIALKRGVKWVKLILTIVILISGVKLLFF